MIWIAQWINSFYLLKSNPQEKFLVDFASFDELH